MSVDPRTMKNMLLAQITPRLELQPAKSAAANTETSEASVFNTLLREQLYGGTGESVAAEGRQQDEMARLWAKLTNHGWITTAYEDGYHYAESSSANPSAMYNVMIERSALKHGVARELIEAVIQTESGFNPSAVSSAGAKGLMQLMDGTARSLGVADSFDPEQNIDGGTKYLSLLLRKYDGNELVALAAYNAGPGRIDRLGIQTNEQLAANLDALPQETRNYIAKVLQVS